MSTGGDAVREKITRAEEHVDGLKAALTSAVGGNAIEVESIEDQPNGKRVTAILKSVDLPPRAGLHLGDAVHNLRSALDHLMCQLAIAAGNADACDRTQFPIFVEDTKSARRRFEGWTNALAKGAQAEIDALQPFRRRPDAPTSDPLWMLSELDNIDKHRVLLIASPKLADARLEVTMGGETRTFTLSSRPEWTPLKLDAMRFRITATGPQNAEVNVKADTSVGVVFAGTGLNCDGKEIFPTVREMIADVKAIVERFEAKGLL